VNTDEQQELAQQLGVRSLPTVVLFKDRTSVDHFVGVVPETQIRRMLEKHLPTSSDAPLERAQALKAAGDFSGARSAIETALAAEPENMTYLTELAELRALDGDLDGARTELERLQGIEPNHASVKRLAALLNFSDVIASHPDVRSIRERAHRTYKDDLARRSLLQAFELIGDADPIVARTRKEMARMLF
jgi:putative thioredoxin